MEIRQLKTFMSIVKLGSFSQAAHFLGYTQSTVTTHIQLLERELNIALFERFGHQLMLTTDGERLYDYAEEIVKLSENAKNELENIDIPHGVITIGIPESICAYHLTQLMKEYNALYPDVNLKLKIDDSINFCYLLRKNVIDIAFFLSKTIQDSDLRSEFLWVEKIVMVAAPENPLAKLAKVTAEQLQGQKLIFTDLSNSYQIILNEYLIEKSIPLPMILELESIDMIKQFVISNLGITLLPMAAVQKEIEAGKLVILPWQGVKLNTNAYLVYHKEKYFSCAIKAFITLVKERLLK
ncbi:LysR family transcriptional regulator [Megasphaera paucivorans]|uniref:DNA-binding transcriptional regulator, LysR family n=1 Tax=Megasphaera paucivorans TaxID=349095 RepID=A0A1G9S6L0_9FIRM|nr:LysR family transcriptional regulator [Megasphaera paucivorans]SDM31143.1 DNA-binding transcriptional regulator, LysR family [Megasphaera paucivorans]